MYKGPKLTPGTFYIMYIPTGIWSNFLFAAIYIFGTLFFFFFGHIFCTENPWATKAETKTFFFVGKQ